MREKTAAGPRKRLEGEPDPPEKWWTKGILLVYTPEALRHVRWQTVRLVFPSMPDKNPLQTRGRFLFDTPSCVGWRMHSKKHYGTIKASLKTAK